MEVRRGPTLPLLLDLQRDRLPRLLQQTDGLAQRLPLQAAAVDGQDAVAHVNGARPANTTLFLQI